ncbi:hypothetical protein JKP88DRAFT_347625 [Tribonema minus]|uniref:Prolyl endopeptidase n=1 Tax=Tribonema minus TaxID=303371 RepID=A0A836CLF5_9STRA|nr:hypothetical protein JKP88DRAFT_347625 [Tribonema minus]
MSTSKDSNKGPLVFLLAASVLGVAGALSLRARGRQVMTAPRAAKRAATVKFGRIPGRNRGPNPMDPPKERVDNYFWIRDDNREHPAVIGHLDAENRFTQSSVAHTKDLREALYKEFLSHLKETDDSVPYQHGPFLYYTRTEKGKSYRIYCRKAHKDAPEHVLLDVNQVAEGHSYCDVGGVGPSPDHTIAAYAVDHSGYETYEIRFKDAASGEMTYEIRFRDAATGEMEARARVPSADGNATYSGSFMGSGFEHTCEGMDEVLKDTSGDFTWGADNSVVYYTTMDEEHRPYRLWRHTLGEPQARDAMLYEEVDKLFWMGISKSDSERFVFMSASVRARRGRIARDSVAGKTTNEVHLVDLQGMCPPMAGKTTSEVHLMDLQDVAGKTTSEVHLVDLQGVAGADGHRTARLELVQERRHNVRYRAEHHGNHLYIITNADGCKNRLVVLLCCIITNADGCKNSKLVRCPLDAMGAKNWREVQPYDPARKLDALLCFEKHLLLTGRQGGLKQMWILDPETGSTKPIEQPEAACHAYPSGNYQFKTSTLRFSYGSLVSPSSTYDYDMNSGARTLLKQQEVPGYDKTKYACERLAAVASDGTHVPISMVYSKDVYANGPASCSAPLMLYGYGSYGHSIEPDFDYTRLSYLDRGVVFAMAHIRGGGEMGRSWGVVLTIVHVRGGGEMGRSWYEDEGKLKTKLNTFTDFVACAEHLIAQASSTSTSSESILLSGVSGITAPDRMALCGRSAGGLLVGAVVNMRPDLFRAAVADVPFVDVINSMCDETIPLTVTEWEEWGNPNEAKYHDYMCSYSPYDNIKAQDYPAMLVTGGLWDPRVAYWEPAKFVAKLRELKTDNNPVLLKIDMSAGHFSASDRYKYLQERAFEFAFVLDQLGATALRQGSASKL